jgi:hypothetical protein
MIQFDFSPLNLGQTNFGIQATHAALRRDSLVICAAALLRYLREALRAQFGRRWGPEQRRAAMIGSADDGEKGGSNSRLLNQAMSVHDPLLSFMAGHL